MRTPQSEFVRLRRTTKVKAPPEGDVFTLVSLRSSDWNTLWASIESLSDRIAENIAQDDSDV